MGEQCSKKGEDVLLTSYKITAKEFYKLKLELMFLIIETVRAKNST